MQPYWLLAKTKLPGGGVGGWRSGEGTKLFDLEGKLRSRSEKNKIFPYLAAHVQERNKKK